MEDKLFPESFSIDSIEPYSFPNFSEICKRLDNLYRISGISLDVLPSEMFYGALKSISPDFANNNPDWMSQSAHSIREIIYDLDKRVKIDDAFDLYGSTYNIKYRKNDLGRFLGFFTDIAHHDYHKAAENPLTGGNRRKPKKITRKLFISIVYEFGEVLYAVLRRQLDVHQEIEILVDENFSDPNLLDKIKSLIYLNLDAKQYFFSKIDEKWLDWLWQNGLLDAIEEPGDGKRIYRYEIVELDYLERIVEKVPEEITKFMLNEKTATSFEKFNPEVVVKFIKIASKLPADQLAKIVIKINRERWVKLMGNLSHWWIEFGNIFDSLMAVKDFDSILLLSEEILSIKSKEACEELNKRECDQSPFIIDDLDYTKVFYCLVEVEDAHLEKAINLLISILIDIVSLEDHSDKDQVFSIKDSYRLSDIDFFSLQPNSDARFAPRKNFRELVAVFIKLIKRLIENNPHNQELLLEIYDKYIDRLPDCISMWRLRLYLLSLDPVAYSAPLKESLNRLFYVIDKGQSYLSIISGTEYEKTLNICFPKMDEDFRKEFFSRMISYFGRLQNIDDENEIKTQYGLIILSNICQYLSEEERKIIKDNFNGECIKEYQPSPSVVIGPAGFIYPQAPIPEKEISGLSVFEIANNLKTIWSPEYLSESYPNDDFLNPINSRGVARVLKADINHRLQNYLNQAGLFFDRESLDKEYTNAFIQGVNEAINTELNGCTSLNIEGFINLLMLIAESGRAEAFDRDIEVGDDFRVQSLSWSAIHYSMASVIKQLLILCQKPAEINLDYLRDQIFQIISYLLTFPDPLPEDEIIETARMTVQSQDNSKMLVSDPLFMAINSVRGKAYEALLGLIYFDEKSLSDIDDHNIKTDVKAIVENLLQKENTRALMFLIGLNVPKLFFRDRDWLSSLLPKIFPKEEDSRHLFIAAWEGYLNNPLYEEIFFNPSFHELYIRGLYISVQDDKDRKFHLDPKEGLATHLALAIIFFHERFSFDSCLFKKFWIKQDDTKILFIDFIGRGIISSQNEKTQQRLYEDAQCIERIKNLWEMILESDSSPMIYKEFGFWINAKEEIFPISWLIDRVKLTLEKSEGEFTWENNFINSIEIFAKVNPLKTLEILRIFLLSEGLTDDGGYYRYLKRDKWYSAFQILYSNQLTKDGTVDLINYLIDSWGRMFWYLKEIIRDY